MATLNTYFLHMLRQINPDKTAVGYATSAHTRVRDRLAKDAEFSKRLVDSFLYGSYKRHTAVGNIKDVDVVILTKFNNDSDDPKIALDELESALIRCGYKKSALIHQDKSIRIDDPLPDEANATLTLDVIPAVQTDGPNDPLRIPSPKDKAWIRTHPKAHIRRTTMLNDESHGNGAFVPLVKIMKRWWKHYCALHQPDVERPKPKGFWLECLTAENFDRSRETYAEHFIAVLESVLYKYRNATEVPKLADPGLQGEDIHTKMTLREFQLFMDAVDGSLETAKEALAEADKGISADLWREVFGDVFAAPTASGKVIEPQSIALKSIAHAQNKWWPSDRDALPTIQLNATLYDDNTPMGRYRSGEEVLYSGLKIRFVANLPPILKYDELLWQVVNTGDHATQENGLRGEYFHAHDVNFECSQSPRVNWESTKYTGRHWIQCFAIRGNDRVAFSERFYVVVVNDEEAPLR